jgi:hypothetical protein
LVVCAGRQPLARAIFVLFNLAMWGLLKDLLAVAAIIAVLVVLAWLSGPDEMHLTTGKTCLEIVNRLAARKDSTLSPAERIDLANCSEP